MRSAVLAWIVLMGAPAVPLPGGTLPGLGGQVIGHAQLLSSEPGAGARLVTPPSEIRLVFSEPIEPRYTSLDLVDQAGRVLIAGAGSRDPADDHVLVVPVPDLPTGTYTVTWRSVSAADGHPSNGFLSFAVGETVQAGPAGGQQTGPAHGSHGTALEIVAKTLGYAGSLLAFGLGVLLVAAVRPGLGRLPGAGVEGQLWALMAAFFGALLLIVVNLDTTAPGGDAGTVGPLDPLRTFVLETRIGLILAGRVAISLGGWIVALLLVRRGRRGWAVSAATLAGALELILIALMGHAASFEGAGPLTFAVVHLLAAGIWFSGVVGLAAMLLIGEVPAPTLRPIVSRFSALAVSAIAIVAASGLYADWLLTRDVLSLGSPYGLSLGLKIAIVGGALVLGAFNYLGGERLGLAFRRRVILEGALAVAVLGATGNLTIGSPPASSLPVEIAPLDGGGAVSSRIELGLAPARPGPNQAWVRSDAPAEAGSTGRLFLRRLDGPAGETQVALGPAADGPVGWRGSMATGHAGSIPSGSHWEARVTIVGPDGVDDARQIFRFAMGADGLVEGRASPALDPVVVGAGLLLAGATLGLGYWWGGGSLPRTERALGRVSLLAGSLVGGLLGLVVLAGPTL